MSHEDEGFDCCCAGVCGDNTEKDVCEPGMPLSDEDQNKEDIVEIAGR